MPNYFWISWSIFFCFTRLFDACVNKLLLSESVCASIFYPPMLCFTAPLLRWSFTNRFEAVSNRNFLKSVEHFSDITYRLNSWLSIIFVYDGVKLEAVSVPKLSMHAFKVLSLIAGIHLITKSSKIYLNCSWSYLSISFFSLFVF